MHASVHDHILKGCGHSTLQTARRTYLQLHCSWGQRRTDYILRSKDQFSVKTRPNIAKKSLNQKMHLSGKCILVDLDDKFTQNSKIQALLPALSFSSNSEKN